MKNYNDKYFSGLYCSDNILLSRKKCAFYWCEQDYWDGYDEKCYVCDMKHQSKLLCYLPYVIQKIILKIHNRRMAKEFKKTLEQYDKGA